MRREKGIEERIVKFLFKETDLEDLENSQSICSVKNEKESFKKNIKVWLNYDSKKSLLAYINRYTAYLNCMETGQNEGRLTDLDLTGQEDRAIHFQTCTVLPEVGKMILEVNQTSSKPLPWFL